MLLRVMKWKNSSSDPRSVASKERHLSRCRFFYVLRQVQSVSGAVSLVGVVGPEIMMPPRRAYQACPPQLGELKELFDQNNDQSCLAAQRTETLQRLHPCWVMVVWLQAAGERTVMQTQLHLQRSILYVYSPVWPWLLAGRRGKGTKR